MNVYHAYPKAGVKYEININMFGLGRPMTTRIPKLV